MKPSPQFKRSMSICHLVFGTLCAFLAALASVSSVASTVSAPALLQRAAPSAWAPIPQNGAQLESEDIENFVDSFVREQNELAPFAGAMAAIVRGGEALFLKGYGSADITTGRGVDERETLFRLGSTSKLFTWIAVMQLVEQGRLDLHVNVNAYLTQFQIPDTFEKPVTLWHLMTHTAGFEDGWAGFLIVRDPGQILPLSSALKQHMPARVRPVGEAALPLASAYSNWGAALAGLIVSNVSGLSFEEYVQRFIFAPLNMKSSTFSEPLPASLEARLSRGHQLQGDALATGWMEYLGNYRPAGAISSTLHDMTRFLQMLTNGGSLDGRRVLGSLELGQMMTTAYRPGQYLPGFGLGFEEYHVNGRTLFGHGGDTPFFHTELLVMPATRVGFLFSVNTAQAGQLPRDFIVEFMDRYFPAITPDVAGFPIQATQLEAIAGTYRSSRRAHTTNEKMLVLPKELRISVGEDGQLEIDDFGEILKFTAVEKDVFRESSGNDVIEIVRNSEGEVIGLEGMGSFERVPWIDRLTTQRLLLAVIIGGFFVVIVRTIRYWSEDRLLPMVLCASLRVNAVVSIGCLLALYLVTRLFDTSPIVLANAFPTSFVAGLWLILGLLPLLAASNAILGLCVVRGEVGRAQSLAIIPYSLASAGFVWMAYHWNLIGFKFP